MTVQEFKEAAKGFMSLLFDVEERYDDSDFASDISTLADDYADSNGVSRDDTGSVFMDDVFTLVESVGSNAVSESEFVVRFYDLMEGD